jgi:hypothetical protein
MIAHSSFRGKWADSKDCRDTRDSNIIKFIRVKHYKGFHIVIFIQRASDQR